MKTTRIGSHLMAALKKTNLAVAMGFFLATGTALAAPANDDFANAIDLTGVVAGQTGDATSGSQTGTDNIDATLQAGEPNPGATNTVWFKWTCTVDGALTVNTNGSTHTPAPPDSPNEWDAILGIYVGTALNALTPLGATPLDTVLQETMTVPVTAGNTYHVQLSGYENQVASNILLNWNFVATIYEANILAFGPGATIDSVTGNAAQISWALPAGSNPATLTPTFTLSPGATCTVDGIPAVSGETRNFTAPVHYIVKASDFATSGTTTDYTVTVSVGNDLSWNLDDGGDWDIAATANWVLLNNTPTTFSNGDSVAFNKSAGGMINIVSDVSPTTTTIGVDAGDYTFSGAPLSGTGSLIMNGFGTLTLNGTNSYSGNTLVNAGTLIVNGRNAIGGSTSFTIANEATLRLNGNISPWPANPATLTGAGTVTVPAAGQANVGFRFNMSSFTGTLNLFGGQFSVNPFYSLGFVPPTNGTLNVGNGTCLYLGWQGTVYTTTVKLSGGTDNGEGLGVLRGDNATLNGTLILATNSTLGSAGGSFTVNAVISDEGNGYGFTTVANGTVTLTATNTYTGPTIVNSGATLKCDTALSLGSGDLRILGKVNLNYSGSRAITALTLGGVAQVDSGTYGSTESGATYQNDVYFSGTGTVTVPPSSAKNILSFNFGTHGDATIDGENITIEVLNGTDVTTLAPTYTASPAASGSPASGATVNFTSPQTYTITAEDLSTKTYNVTVVVRPPSSAADITAFGANVPGSFAQFVNTGSTAAIIIWSVPADTTVETLAPSYALSPGATCPRANPGIPTPPLSTLTYIPYVVTSQDGTTIKTYNVIVKIDSLPPVAGYSRWFDASKISDKENGDPITFWDDLSENDADATVPFGNASPIYDANAGMSSGRPAVRFAKNTNATNSAALRFGKNSSIRTVFSVFKGNSFLLTDDVTYDFHRPGDDNPSEPLWASFASPSITNGSTYVNGALVNGTNFGMPTNLQNGFNLVEVVTTGNVSADSFNKDRTFHSGDQSHAELLIYDRVLTEAERISVEDYLTNKWMLDTSAATIVSFGSGATIDPLVNNAANISLTVPFGTNLATLAPAFTLSSGATCNQTSGAIPSPNFSTGPLVYTVTSFDAQVTNTYTVSIIVTPESTEKTLSNFYFPGRGYAWATNATGVDLKMVVPNATNVTALAPTFNLPAFASCNIPSGTTRDFTTPQTYTVTAQDGSTQIHTVTVEKIASTGSGSYQQKVLASGPVSYWPLNETSGTTAFDLASGMNPITYGGTLTLNQPGLRADGNPSVQFTTAAADPENTRAQNNNSLNPREFTVECWVKPSDSTVQYLVSIQDRTSGGRTGYALWRNNGTNKYGMQIGTGPATTTILNSTTDTVVGTAAHVVATYDGTTLKMYVNGVLENTLVTPYQIASANQPGFTIASRNGITAAASQMQDVALYTRALTLEEIQNHFQVTYSDWASANAGGQSAGQDFNNDGIQNGVAYFMGSTGMAINPQIDASNTVSWPMSLSFSGNYEVQTSPDLSTWTDVIPRPLPTNGILNYNLPTGLGKQFLRLRVTPAP